MTLLDDFVPKFQFVERHSTTIPAARADVYQALRQVDFGRSRVIRLLFALRGMGRWFRHDRSRMRLRLEDFERAGFILLAERPNEEVVIGIVSGVAGRSRGLRRVDAQRFAAFEEAGCMKAALNFRLESLDSSSTLVTTETRVLATDEPARRAFGRYWLVVGPFSALIRRRMLAVLRDAIMPSGGVAGQTPGHDR